MGEVPEPPDVVLEMELDMGRVENGDADGGVAVIGGTTPAPALVLALVGVFSLGGGFEYEGMRDDDDVDGGGAEDTEDALVDPTVFGGIELERSNFGGGIAAG